LHHILKVEPGPASIQPAFPEEFPDALSARTAAVRVLRTMMVDQLGRGKAIPSEWTVQIVDAAGEVIEILSAETVAFDRGTAHHRYRRLYNGVHHPYLLLTPDLVILEANPAYLNATMTDFAAIRRRNLFDIFPNNPADPKASGERNLAASLQRVLDRKEPHRMPRQRYDIRSVDGTWEERYWDPVNFPLLDENGEVEFVVHHVEDVTGDVIGLRAARNDEAQYYALKARDCERIARRLSDLSLQKQMLAIASQWREMESRTLYKIHWT
jgi:PAS domain-containing protein